ncbi:DNA-processing protein DprA [Leptospira sp. 96542]|nr:DNA-processing protein DprA [Leptospira sp. 96542]
MDPLVLSHPKVTSFLRKTNHWSKFDGLGSIHSFLSQYFDKSLYENIERMAKVWRETNPKNIQIIAIFDPIYPPLLKEIYDPPLVLACLGNTDLLSNTCLAIVGTRKASPISLKATESLVVHLVKESVTFVSGLALGIDRKVFETALKEGSNVIGVLGTPITEEYPPGNRDLYKTIKSNNQNLLVTEFILDVKPARWTFPKRNRVIAGLAERVYIMESGKKSGTIFTAKAAMDENREIYVFDHPSQFDNEGGKLLIRDGAIKIQNEILLGYELTEKQGDSEIIGYESWRKQSRSPQKSLGGDSCHQPLKK